MKFGFFLPTMTNYAAPKQVVELAKLPKFSNKLKKCITLSIHK
ncbi:MAG: hypothetical protein OEY49_13740 [Candidatus Heimdallarchaeota archaeon]|nr:hypothetical protein [Candidatus Heimdallarchaeota archaeon]